MKQQHQSAYLTPVIWLVIGSALTLLLFVPIDLVDVRGAVVYSTTAQLRLREAPVTDPGDTSNVKTKLDPAHPLLVLGEVKNSFGWWLNVRDEVNGNEGWAFAAYLRATPTVRTVTTTVPFGRIAGRRAGVGLVRLQLLLRRGAQELGLIVAIVTLVVTVLQRRTMVFFMPPTQPSPSSPAPPGSSVGPANAISGTNRGHYTSKVYVPRRKK